MGQWLDQKAAASPLSERWVYEVLQSDLRTLQRIVQQQVPARVRDRYWPRGTRTRSLKGDLLVRGLTRALAPRGDSKLREVASDLWYARYGAVPGLVSAALQRWPATDGVASEQALAWMAERAQPAWHHVAKKLGERGEKSPDLPEGALVEGPMKLPVLTGSPPAGNGLRIGDLAVELLGFRLPKKNAGPVVEALHAGDLSTAACLLVEAGGEGGWSAVVLWSTLGEFAEITRFADAQAKDSPTVLEQARVAAARALVALGERDLGGVLSAVASQQFPWPSWCLLVAAALAAAGRPAEAAVCALCLSGRSRGLSVLHARIALALIEQGGLKVPSGLRDAAERPWLGPGALTKLAPRVAEELGVDPELTGSMARVCALLQRRPEEDTETVEDPDEEVTAGPDEPDPEPEPDDPPEESAVAPEPETVAPVPASPAPRPPPVAEVTRPSPRRQPAPLRPELAPARTMLDGLHELDRGLRAATEAQDYGAVAGLAQQLNEGLQGFSEALTRVGGSDVGEQGPETALDRVPKNLDDAESLLVQVGVAVHERSRAQHEHLETRREALRELVQAFGVAESVDLEGADLATLQEIEVGLRAEALIGRLAQGEDPGDLLGHGPARERARALILNRSDPGLGRVAVQLAGLPGTPRDAATDLVERAIALGEPDDVLHEELQAALRAANEERPWSLGAVLRWGSDAPAWRWRMLQAVEPSLPAASEQLTTLRVQLTSAGSDLQAESRWPLYARWAATQTRAEAEQVVEETARWLHLQASGSDGAMAMLSEGRALVELVEGLVEDAAPESAVLVAALSAKAGVPLEAEGLVEACAQTCLRLAQEGPSELLDGLLVEPDWLVEQAWGAPLYLLICALSGDTEVSPRFGYRWPEELKESREKWPVLMDQLLASAGESGDGSEPVGRTEREEGRVALSELHHELKRLSSYSNWPPGTTYQTTFNDRIWRLLRQLEQGAAGADKAQQQLADWTPESIVQAADAKLGHAVDGGGRIAMMRYLEAQWERLSTLAHLQGRLDSQDLSQALNQDHKTLIEQLVAERSRVVEPGQSVLGEVYRLALEREGL